MNTEYSLQEAITLIGKEWDQPDGFLGKLRMREFDKAGLERLKQILVNLKLPQENVFPKEFVKLTWFIPTFMSWQQERLVDGGQCSAKEYDAAETVITELLLKILGVP